MHKSLPDGISFDAMKAAGLKGSQKTTELQYCVAGSVERPASVVAETST